MNPNKLFEKAFDKQPVITAMVVGAVGVAVIGAVFPTVLAKISSTVASAAAKVKSFVPGVAA